MYGTEASSDAAYWAQGADLCASLTFSIPEGEEKQSANVPSVRECSVDEFFGVDFVPGHRPTLSDHGPAHHSASIDAAKTSPCLSHAGTDSGTYDAAREQEKLCAFLAAAEKHRSRLLWLAKRITNSQEEAEDVVQHALLKAFVNLSKFRGDSQMSTWLGAIVQNTAREHMRSLRGKVFLPLEFAPDEEGESVAHDLPDPSETPEERFAVKERQEVVRSAMNSLTENHRLALQLCVMEDLPYLRAANMLDVTLSSMKSRVFRGKQLLKVAVSRSLNPTV